LAGSSENAVGKTLRIEQRTQGLHSTRTLKQLDEGRAWINLSDVGMLFGCSLNGLCKRSRRGCTSKHV
jgi:hypothetical protein